jgi:hypothetical protein
MICINRRVRVGWRHARYLEHAVMVVLYGKAAEFIYLEGRRGYGENIQTTDVRRA